MGWSSSWSWDDDFFGFGGPRFLMVFGFPSRDSSSSNPFILTRMVLSFSRGADLMCVWHIGAPCDQSNLHWLAIFRIGTLHSGIILFAIVRGMALEKAGG